jgi:lysophospholipase L1-like esterase
MDAEPGRDASPAAWISLVVVAGCVVFLLQACFGTTEAPVPLVPPEPPSTRLSSPEALAPFFTSLAALDTRQAQQPMRILQIGDSHTANDALSGRMREHFQSRFGEAGRGWLPAGIPFKYYRSHLVSVSESGWEHVKPSDHAGVALGLDAIAAVSQPPDAQMVIQSTEERGFDRFGVEFLTQPNGATFTVSVDDGIPIRISTATAMTAIKRVDLPLDHPAHQVMLHATGRPPVVLLGWAVERQTPGVIYENHGTIGATVGLLGQMTPEAVSFEFSERSPALLIVAFGTNEGFDDDLDLNRYAARFEGNVKALRQAANGAPVLILGAPDGNRAARGCPHVDCGSTADECAWHEPIKLAAVREIQRRTAARQHWAYWDWFAAMGGTCSIDRMAQADPPQAMRDHVHLSTPGYRAVADLLFGDLMHEYGRWKAQPRTS